MIRKIIEINEALCNGCGQCAHACHEGAIGMVNGKAKLLREDYCDGLGNCLPACPTGAITFVEREAAAFDKAAVEAAMQGGCPGSRMQQFAPLPEVLLTETPSQLRQWPVQIQLVPVRAPYFAGADLLVAADCTAYAYGGVHQQFMAGRVTLIGCPKLDPVDYTEKLTAICRENEIKSVTVLRMEVPCCSGIAHAAQTAAAGSGIPCRTVVISTDGKILSDS